MEVRQELTPDMEAGAVDGAGETTAIGTQPDVSVDAGEAVVAVPSHTLAPRQKHLGEIAGRQIQLIREIQQAGTGSVRAEGAKRSTRRATDALRIATQGLLSQGRRELNRSAEKTRMSRTARPAQ